MRIKRIIARHIRIPLKVKFSQSNNSTRFSSSVVLELETENGHKGFGECCPRRYVTNEDIHTVVYEIQALQDLFLNVEINDLNHIRDLFCNRLPRHTGQATMCALELAILDAFCKENNNTVAALLGGDLPAKIAYAGVIPLGKMQHLKPILTRFRFPEIKFKATDNLLENIARVHDIRDIYGPDMKIRLDANCSWDLPIALHQMPTLIELGVSAFEQVFPANRYGDFGKLTARFGDQVGIMVDESLCTYAQAKFLAENGLCNHFNLKISKNGGLLNTIRIIEVARKHGIQCQLGAHFGETSILTAAGIALVSAAPDLTAMEGALGDILLENDITSKAINIDWEAQVFPRENIQNSGLGVSIEITRLLQYTEWEVHCHLGGLAYAAS